MFSFLPEQQIRKDSNPRLWFWRPPFSPTKLRTYESVGIAGFEPTISSTPSRRITKLSHIPRVTVLLWTHAVTTMPRPSPAINPENLRAPI